MQVAPGYKQQRGGSSRQMLPRGQRLPHCPQLDGSRVVSVQVPAGLAPQQLNRNGQAGSVPQRQVLSVQVLVDSVQLALPQHVPLTQIPAQQTPLAIDWVEQRVRSGTGG